MESVITVQRVVESLLNDLANITQHSEKIPQDQVHIRLESERTIKEFKTLLTSLAQSQAIADVKSLQPLRDFLEKRWDLIKDTNAIYFYQKKTHANKVCMALARTLSAILDVPVYQLLVPTLETVSGDLNVTNPKHFVLSDDGSALIDIKKCLQAAEKDPLHELLHTSPGKENELLSEEEKVRVINNSAQSQSYYNAFTKVPSTYPADKARKNFSHKIRSSGITQAYGKAGDELLVSRLYPTREALLQCMGEISSLEWDALLQKFNLDKLKAMILDGRELMETVTDKNSYKSNQTAFNTALYSTCFYIYKHLLVARPAEFNYVSQAYLPEYFSKPYSKTTKNKASDYPFKLLLEGVTPDKLKAETIAAIDKDPKLDSYEKASIKRALDQGNLKTLMDASQQVISIDHLKAAEKQSEAVIEQPKSRWRIIL